MKSEKSISCCQNNSNNENSTLIFSKECNKKLCSYSNYWPAKRTNQARDEGDTQREQMLKAIVSDETIRHVIDAVH